jgi:RNA polymerase sigma-70 factor, ECF subfamily
MQHDSPAQLAPLNREAFQSFYRENLGPIYRYVYGKLGNREEAEDLTARIFIKAVRHIDHEQNPQSIRSWLFQVARTTIADYWRAYYRTATSSLDALLEAGWEGPIEHEDEEQPFEIHSSSADHAQRLLQALPERDREVLTCRFLLGLSVRETAVRIGVTEGNVKTMQFRALKRAADLDSPAQISGNSHN